MISQFDIHLYNNSLKPYIAQTVSIFFVTDLANTVKILIIHDKGPKQTSDSHLKRTVILQEIKRVIIYILSRTKIHHKFILFKLLGVVF